MITTTALLFVSLFGRTAFAQHPDVNVGIIQHPPICSIDNGVPSGLFVEIVNRVGEDQGWRLHFSQCPVDSGIVQLQDHRLDLLLGLDKEQASAHSLSINQEDVISTWAQVYSTPTVKILSVLDLEGKTVGVVKSEHFKSEVRTLFKGFGLTVQTVEFASQEELLNALSMSWVDAGVMDRLGWARPGLPDGVVKSSVVFSPVEFRYCGSERSAAMLSIIDYKLVQLKNDPNSIYFKALNKLFFDTSDQTSINKLRWILSATIGVIGLAVGVIYLLRTQVQSKTSEVGKANLDLTAEIALRREAEVALRDTVELLEETFSELSDGIVIVSRGSRRIVKVNRAARTMLNAVETGLIDRSPKIIFPSGESYEIFERDVLNSIKVNSLFKGEINLMRLSGEVFPAEMSISPVHDVKGGIKFFACVIRDRTTEIEVQAKLAQSEMRLRQAQKMEALGTLAGGIAHDFNNILTPIMGYCELVSMKYARDAELSITMEQIMGAAERARDLVSQILTFSRKSDKERRPLRIGTITKEVVKLIRASTPTNITITTKITAKHDWVEADPTEIHQVLMNLCSNATYAMRETGGKLEIGLTEQSGEPLGYFLGQLDTEKKYICLSVKDTGGGIPDHLIERIFDPFFTTKKPGEGTGLGLSLAHGIVTATNGLISVESTADVGTTFHVHLPVTPATIETASKKERSEMIGKGERILLVDDEESIIKMVSQGLGGIGFNVIPCSNGLVGLETFLSNPSRIDLVITDQSMPQMTGSQMAKRMLEIRPDLPIILCTGFSESITAESAKELGIAEYINKPYSFAKLAIVMKSLLERPNEAKLLSSSNNHGENANLSRTILVSSLA
jgi:PAS domain S-box-containing protein